MSAKVSRHVVTSEPLRAIAGDWIQGPGQGFLNVLGGHLAVYVFGAAFKCQVPVYSFFPLAPADVEGAGTESSGPTKSWHTSKTRSISPLIPEFTFVLVRFVRKVDPSRVILICSKFYFTVQLFMSMFFHFLKKKNGKRN